jgi:hypothetical protein
LGLSPYLGHRPAFGALILGEMVLHRLLLDALLQQCLDLLYAGALAQRGPQIYFLIREQAGPQLPIGGETKPIAVVAKVHANGRDKTNRTRSIW